MVRARPARITNRRPRLWADALGSLSSAVITVIVVRCARAKRDDEGATRHAEQTRNHAGRAFQPRGEQSGQRRSNALENFRASHPCHAAVWSDVCRDPSCGNGCRANKASIPDRGRSAICRPVPRRLECNPRSANAPCEIVGYPRTSARWSADEYSREISRSGVDRQNLQHRAPLTLPNRGG
jgi:hypothetical protein